MQGALPQLSTDAPALTTWRNELLREMKPWKDFFDVNKLTKPAALTGSSSGSVQARLNHNLIHFKTNYMCVVGLLAAYTLVRNLWLLLSVLLIAAGYAGLRQIPDNTTLMIAGRYPLTKRQLWYVWLGFSVGLFLFSSAGSAIFWLLGISGCLIGVHGGLRDVDVENEFAPVNQSV